MYKEYIERKVVRETKKAYLVLQEVNNPRDGWRTNFRWVAKSICKEYNGETALVPEWIVGNGIW